MWKKLLYFLKFKISTFYLTKIITKISYVLKKCEKKTLVLLKIQNKYLLSELSYHLLPLTSQRLKKINKINILLILYYFKKHTTLENETRENTHGLKLFKKRILLSIVVI